MEIFITGIERRWKQRGWGLKIDSAKNCALIGVQTKDCRLTQRLIISKRKMPHTLPVR